MWLLWDTCKKNTIACDLEQSRDKEKKEYNFKYSATRKYANRVMVN